jgi:hypothetical protein
MLLLFVKRTCYHADVRCPIGHPKQSGNISGTDEQVPYNFDLIKKGSNKIRSLISGRGSRLNRAFTFDKIRPIKTLWQQQGIELD